MIKKDKINKVRPTQAVVGEYEVQLRKKQFLSIPKHELEQHLQDKWLVPCITGPDDHLHIIDRHHCCKALYELGHEWAYFDIKLDLSSLTAVQFIKVMKALDYFYLYDSDWNKIEVEDLPKHISQLVDAPYRSLSGLVRKAGGYEKTGVPFEEFEKGKILSDKMNLQAFLSQSGTPEENWKKAIEFGVYLLKENDNDK